MCLSLPVKKAKTSSNSGTVLIVTLWILIILTVFAIALGQQASLEVKLSQYQRDKLKATELAKAAIERALWEKANDPDKDIDALNQPWANNPTAFKDFELGAGTFRVSFSLDGVKFYGMQDETAKININQATEQTLVRLLEAAQVEDAQAVASSILIWSAQKQDPAEEEDDYYQALDVPYHCKKEEFKSIPELLLVRGITAEILYGEDSDQDGRISEQEAGIIQHLTVYGKGLININTASTQVLGALIDDRTLVDEIIAYRKGDDQELGTQDDGWFSGASFNASEWNLLLPLKDLFSFNSNIYTIYAQAEVKKVKASIHTTVDFSDPAKITYLSWRKD